ncbi:MAG: DUF3108 domain-containing protein [Burkholderiales bacterium]
MHGAKSDSSAAAGRRWKALAALAVLALLLHASALSDMGWAWPQRDTPRLPAPAMLVRAVVQAPVNLPAEPMPPVLPVRSEPVVIPPRLPRAPLAAARPVALAEVAAVPLPVVMPVVLALPAKPSAAPALEPTPTPTQAEPASAPAEERIPTYRTQLPPAATLRYDMQRGGLRGNGELQWRPGTDRYELKLEGRVAGLTILTQVSQGGFDSAGIAPQRFTDRRIRRPQTAANFQREAGKITYSGPQTEYPLHAGAQDRLSWMIELGAVVAAEPALGTADAKVVMFVSGSHGDAGAWVFRSLGLDTVDSRSGEVAAIHFKREPRGPYDTTVEVWLDPKRHHLPVRALLRSGPNDDGLDLRLQDIDTSP